jgi:hypothetical protein
MFVEHVFSNRYRLNRAEKRLGGFQIVSSYVQLDYPAQGSIP